MKDTLSTEKPPEKPEAEAGLSATTRSAFVVGDCLDVMQTMPNNSFDVAVTSPPYNLGGDFHEGKGSRTNFGGYESFGDDMPEGDYQDWQLNVLNELHRIVSGVCFYNHKIRIKGGFSINPLEWITKTEWHVMQEIVLDFGATANVDKCRCFPVTERIYVLMKTGAKIENVENYTDCWKMRNVPRAISGHPATFHEDLAERCLRLTPWAKSVIDPFSGTGTVGLVAERMGLKFLGCDVSKKYTEIANSRRASNQMLLI